MNVNATAESEWPRRPTNKNGPVTDLDIDYCLGKARISMIHRCTNPAHPNYVRYGAVGVTVCPSWAKSRHQFLQDCRRLPNWCFKLKNPRMWDLDKDITAQCDKLYSAETCSWMPRALNRALNFGGLQCLKTGEIYLGSMDASKRTNLARITVTQSVLGDEPTKCAPRFRRLAANHTLVQREIKKRWDWIEFRNEKA